MIDEAAYNPKRLFILETPVTLRTTQLLLILFLSSLSPLSLADHIKINNAWIREAPPVSKVLAAFMDIDNHASDTVYIIAVESRDFGAIEMHLSKEENGVARMLPQSQLVIPAKGKLMLKPGSYHLMLFRPQKRLKKGDTAEFTFTLGNGEKFTKSIAVK
ncbi:MAG: copper chaperone PCu(A)C [Gammaproteobacteria bacterium]|nr:copper chaperone PCu(A)C [Gammaproteobacteria bacterium]